MLAAHPNAAPISRSFRRAPSDRTEHLLDPPCPQHGGVFPFPAVASPNAITIRPSRAPHAYGSSLSTPRRAPLAAGSSFWLGSRPRRRARSRASAHVSFSRFSVIGSPRSSDSSRVAAERRRSSPPHSFRRHPLGPIPIRLVGDIPLRSSPRSEHPPKSERPLQQEDPRDPTSPPSTKKRSRAPSPVATIGDGARTFFEARAIRIDRAHGLLWSRA